MLMARLVRNFAANTYSLRFRFFDFVRLSLVPSSAIRGNFSHSLRISSMSDAVFESFGKERERRKVFPRSQEKKTQQALLLTVLAGGGKYHSEEDNQILHTMVSRESDMVEKIQGDSLC